jgi:hypothetical protein
MHEIPRSLVILKPKQPFLNWINSQPTDIEPFTLSQASEAMDGILIPQFGLPKLAMAYVEANVERLFDYVLKDWGGWEHTWPPQRDLDTFHRWFDVEVHCTLCDAADTAYEVPSLN